MSWGSIGSDARKTAGEEDGDALADGVPVESPATADTVEREDTDESGKLVRQRVHMRDQK